MKKYKLVITQILFFAMFQLTFAQIQNPRNIPFNWKTDLTNANVDLSEITMVLPRHSFPTLDYPEYVGKAEGLKLFFSKEPVLAVEINGEAKAYSLNMLTVHEISNDTLSGVPILATYCPLCNSGIVYDRRLNYKGKDYLLDFEVSGMLRKSDMVMGDKQTESLWQQLLGKAIVGKLAGAELKIIPSLVISVQEFFNRYPNGKILSKSNGDKNMETYYGKNYYEKYDSPDGKPYQRFFNSGEIDSRLPAMERVVDIISNGEYQIYSYSAVAKTGVINDEFNSKKIVLFYQPGIISILDEKNISESKDIGTVTAFSPVVENKALTFRKENDVFKDDETNSNWDITGKCTDGKLKGKQLKIETHGTHFAFAWLAFHPETNIYGQK